MILQSTQVRAILAGRKTQMRVPVAEPADIQRRNGTSYRSTPFRPHVGRPIVISQATRLDGKDISTPVCNVLVTDYHHALLHSPDEHGAGGIDIHAAIAEGHKTTDDFKAWWVREHDRAWLAAQVRKHDIEPGDETLVERFEKRHTLRPVWVITFAIETAQRVRTLAETGRGDDRGYKLDHGHGPSRAPRPNQIEPFSPTRLVDEPETVDDVAHAKIAREAREYDEMRAAGVDEALIDSVRSLRSQRREYVRLAGERGINARDEMRMWDRAENSLIRKIHEQRTNRLAA